MQNPYEVARQGTGTDTGMVLRRASGLELIVATLNRKTASSKPAQHHCMNAIANVNFENS
jgi:hypothetical protein